MQRTETRGKGNQCQFATGSNGFYTLGLLEKFVPEKKQEERRIMLSRKDIEAIGQVVGVFQYEFLDRHHSLNYREELKKLSPSARQIELFSLHMNQVAQEVNWAFAGKPKEFAFGWFINEAIDASPDREFVLHTGHLDFLLNKLGEKSGKSIIVKGSVGDCCGQYMTKTGRVVVEGDAGDCLGNWMEGGRIIVKGSVGEKCGTSMKGGEIDVGGNAGHRCGYCSWSGKIRVAGSIASIDEDVCRAAVFEAGKLVCGEIELSLPELIAYAVKSLFRRVFGNGK